MSCDALRDIAFAASPNAKLGAAVMVAPISEQVVSHSDGPLRKARGRIRHNVPAPAIAGLAATHGVRHSPINPMSCERGSHEQTLSPGAGPSASRIARMLEAIAVRLRRTPFALKVLPDVNCTKSPTASVRPPLAHPRHV